MAKKVAAATAAVLGGSFAAFKIFEADVGLYLVNKMTEDNLKAAGLERQVVDVGETVRVLVREGGPHDIFIIPGFTATAALVQELAKACPTDYRVVIIEVPYQGESEVPNHQGAFPDVRALLDTVYRVVQALRRGPRVTLMGYSLGGGLAARYAAAYPEEVDAAVLLAPAFPETMADGFKASVDAGDFRKVHGWETEEEMVHFFTKGGLDCYPENMPPGFVLKAMAKQRRLVGPGYYSRFGSTLFQNPQEDTLLSQELVPKLRISTVPMLMCVGERDSCISARKCDVIASSHPNCQSHVIEDCGHFGGPKGKPKRNFLTESCPFVRDFLARPRPKL